MGTDRQSDNGLKAVVGEEFIHPQMVEIAKRRTKFREAMTSKRAVRIGWGLAFLAVLALEAALSSSALITPLPAGLLWIQRFLGFVAGCFLAKVFWNIGRDQGRIWLVRVGMALFLPLAGAMTLELATYRMAVWWEFGFSSAPFERASYPIKGLDRGRRWPSKDSIEIDPFRTGLRTHIPIPESQLVSLRAFESPLCVVVMQRRSPAGAIEVRTDGQQNLSTPAAAEVIPCATGVGSNGAGLGKK